MTQKEKADRDELLADLKSTTDALNNVTSLVAAFDPGMHDTSAFRAAIIALRANYEKYGTTITLALTEDNLPRHVKGWTD